MISVYKLESRESSFNFYLLNGRLRFYGKDKGMKYFVSWGYENRKGKVFLIRKEILKTPIDEITGRTLIPDDEIEIPAKSEEEAKKYVIDDLIDYCSNGGLRGFDKNLRTSLKRRKKTLKRLLIESFN